MDIIYLKTQNDQKLKEYTSILGQHNIHIQQVKKTADDLALLASVKIGKRVRAVMEETTNLHDADSGDIVLLEEFYSLRPLVCRTVLRVAMLNAQQDLVEFTYRAEINGHISLSKRTNELGVFAWDDVFENNAAGQTFFELSKRGRKVSSRDLAIAQFSLEHLAFKNRLDLKAFPQNPVRTIDFSRPVADTVLAEALFSNENSALYGIGNAIVHSLNQGLFWRSARNRRERVYWMTNGNGFVPYTGKINKATGKPDLVHEMTFLPHDVFHNGLIPDPTPDGIESTLHDKVLLIWRMLGESDTLVAADMLFVDTLKKSGIPYTYDRRSIYPLFESLHGSFDSPKRLKELFNANVRYSLRGDKSSFYELGATKEAFARYEGKFKSCFIEDYYWANKNLNYMRQKAATFRLWQKMIDPLRSSLEEAWGYMTISQCVDMLRAHSTKDLEALSHDALVDLAHNVAFDRLIVPVLFGGKRSYNAQCNLKRGFLKYISAQAHIFAVFADVPESVICWNGILVLVENMLRSEFSLEGIDAVRDRYDHYLGLLYKRQLITLEDRKMYTEIFPILPAHYGVYDQPAESYPDISQVSSELLNCQNDPVKF